MTLSLYFKGFAFKESCIRSIILTALSILQNLKSMQNSSPPYRKGQSIAVAVEELKGYAGVQFDAEIVEVFFSFLDEKDLPWLRRRDAADYAHISVPA